MKKLTILTIVIVLLALATPAMSDVVVSGNVKYGVTLGPNTVVDELTSDEKREATITVTGTPDENNTATIKLNAHELWADNPAGALDKAMYECDLLPAFGVGTDMVGVKLTGGFWEVGNADVGKFSGYECEDVVNTKIKAWQFGVDVSIMDMVTVRAGIDPSFNYQSTSGVTPSNADDANIGYVIGAFGGVEMVQAEIFYTNAGAPAEEPGTLGMGVGVSLTFGDIGLNIGVNAGMDLAEGSDPIAELGIGIGFSYGTLLSAGIGTYGYIGDVMDSSVVNIIGVNVDVTPIEMITIFAGLKIGVDSDFYADAFRLLDVGLKTKAGALELAAGFQYRPDSATDDDPGKEDLYPYNTNSAEGGVFIQANLGF
jgi:hypothetical protein